MSTTSSADGRTLVLKHGDSFMASDSFGDIGARGVGDGGLYHRDTRYVSRLRLRIGDVRPVLLSSSVSRDNALMSADLTNADITSWDVVAVPHGTLHLFRCRLLWEGVCHERLRLQNYGHLPVSLPMDLDISCDFADIFEVRGMTRQHRGRVLEPYIGDDTLEFGYEGLDGRTRRTRVMFSSAPMALSEKGVRYDVRIEPAETAVYEWDIHCEIDDAGPSRTFVGFSQAADRLTEFMKPPATSCRAVYTGNDLFDRWIERSLSDLRMLRTETRHGSYAYAGIPWFSTVFGRDGIITAMETLWYDPAIARGVLTYLAHTQATEEIPERDAQPGKIVHEMRDSEMATLGEVPFRRYYGSIDSTPLFVVLAGAYFDRTGDREFASALWPHVEQALHWMAEYGDADKDGFIEYARMNEGGLLHQGWKDSSDPVFHEDGTLAETPIALCEVQGYAYAAYLAAGRLAAALGFSGRAEELQGLASDLRGRFERAFWVGDLGTYALALDGDKRVCRVRTSNAGHCLFSGIASDEHAARMARTFSDEQFFSGWGVRTVAASEARYNPMSYHNGSVWPHDNAMIAAGLARYGHKRQALRIMEGLFEASTWFDLHRLPELFCGFHKRQNQGPTLYPVACSPQAWASGAVLMLLQACLGLQVCGPEREVLFTEPVLPWFLQRVVIEGLRVDDASVDIELAQHDGDVGLRVLNSHGEVSVRLGG